MDLKFKYSNIAVFRIVEYDNKTFILDSTSIKGKSYFLGWLPKKVTANMVELSPSNDSFEIKSRFILSSFQTIKMPSFRPANQLIYFFLNHQCDD